ncbi:MAG: hypothetical protein KAH08_06045 [Methylococcales bacterium]|nr:hypothetical protein [Methylococcales bacterium]MCK5898643.1 hypothetical protein [Methylococcales bacterium]
MTDDDLKALVASLAVAQQETDRKLDKVAKILGGISMATLNTLLADIKLAHHS